VKTIIVFVAALLIWMPPAQAVKPVAWQDLKDPVSAEFDDPFAALSIRVLRSLGKVLQFRQQLEQPGLSEASRPDIEHQLRNEEAKLAAAGVQTDWLLSQRKEIGKQRAKAALSGNADLAGEEISITGYVIPVQSADSDQVVTGYLVPEAGMCSHMPAPDPNQMIRYKLDTDYVAKDIYEPVELTGRLSLKMTRQEITLLDGQVEMLAAFEMDVTNVRRLEEQTQPIGSRFLRFFKGKQSPQTGVHQ
jgi:hypothetical protein